MAILPPHRSAASFAGAVVLSLVCWSAAAAQTAPGETAATPAPAASSPPASPPATPTATATTAPAATTTATAPFYTPIGELHGSSAKGFTDTSLFAPGMRFPIQDPKAFANSQVYGHGGSDGPAGGQCDAANYQLPWHDNFCESRGYSTPMCPAGIGHQGQDIRPNTCQKAHYTAVAAEDGTISQIASYTVYLTAKDGRLYRYLHLQMDKLKVHVGQHVQRGEPIGLVSNNFGKTATTIHLHFEIKEPVTHKGAALFTFVPPYSSLVDAYQRLLVGTP